MGAKNQIKRTVKLIALFLLSAVFSVLVYLNFKVKDVPTRELPQKVVKIKVNYTPFNRNVAGPYLCARFAQGHGDWAAARSYMQWAAYANPSDEGLAYHAMVLTAGAGFVDTAAKIAQKIIKSEGYSSDSDGSQMPYIILISNYLANGKIDEANAMIAKTNEIYGDDAFYSVGMTDTKEVSEKMFEIGASMFNADQVDSARIFLQMAIKLNSDLRKAIILMGEIHSVYGNNKQALAYFKSVSKPVDEVYVRSRQQAADLLVELELQNEAIDVLSTLSVDTEGVQKVQILIQIAEIYRSLKEYDKAIPYYNEAISEFKKFPDTQNSSLAYMYFLRSFALYDSNDWKSAEVDLKAALEITPDDAGVLNTLGYIWIDKNINKDKASEMLNKALYLEPDNYHIIDSVGWAFYKNENWDNAVELLERASEIAPYDDVVISHLGDAYWMSKRYAEARFQWKRALNYSDDPDLISELEEKLKFGLSSQ